MSRVAQRERKLCAHLASAGVCLGAEQQHPHLTVYEAIVIVQRHERARQARAQAQLAKALANSAVSNPPTPLPPSLTTSRHTMCCL